jgi:drug/metabolite transporter (DMT)-like permease
VGSAVLRGLPLPSDADAHAWVWLAVSGLVGFTFGDMCLFRAFLLIGARLSVLIMTLVPPMTAVIGWLVLGETLTGLDLLGMFATLSGVMWVVTERAPSTSEDDQAGDSSALSAAAVGKTRRRIGVGVALAVGGALGQAGGLVLSKYGMGEYNAIAATQIRVIAGMLGFAAVFTAIGWWPRVWAARNSPGGLGYTAVGAICGPVLGVTLSLYAVQHIQTGIASSIMSTTPLLIIPMSAAIHKERVSARTVVGTVVAIVGVTLLFL